MKNRLEDFSNIKIYTAYGKHNFIDDEDNPRILDNMTKFGIKKAEDSPLACAKVILEGGTDKKIYYTYYIRMAFSNRDLFNPHREDDRPRLYYFNRVSKECFDCYLSFLKGNNKINFVKAQEIVNEQRYRKTEKVQSD